MENELKRIQAGEETVAYESFRRWLSCCFGKMWQSTILEAICYTIPTYTLLADSGDHLGDIEVGSFRARLSHDNCGIAIAQLL